MAQEEGGKDSGGGHVVKGDKVLMAADFKVMYKVKSNDRQFEAQEFIQEEKNL